MTSAVLLAAGLVALVANLAWCYFPVAFYGEKVDPNLQILAEATFWVSVSDR